MTNMANTANMSADAPEMQLKQLKETKKQFAQEQKNQRKEAKQKAKELEKQQRELDEQIEGNGIPVVLVTLFIIFIWLGIIVLLIKMDVGGFGTNVMTPMFKDTPIINKMLPEDKTKDPTKSESYGGYASLQEAVEQIRKLELSLDQAQTTNNTYAEQIELLKAEVERLQTFEKNQVEFQRIKEQFYEEVIYAENGPGPDEYRSYYEEMDPVTAQSLYKQVIASVATDKKMADYINTFSNMDAAAAAKIIENMTDNLDLAAKILSGMNATSRAEIMGNMEPTIAAKVTKIMAPSP